VLQLSAYIDEKNGQAYVYWIETKGPSGNVRFGRKPIRVDQVLQRVAEWLDNVPEGDER
jgi:hypothetical protein